MSSGKSLSNSAPQILKFLDTHIHRSARFKTVIQYSVPGQAPQQNEMAMDKKKFIENIKTGTDSMNDYESAITISKIQISKDGRKATLETQSNENGMMTIVDPESGQQHQVPVLGASQCQQIIMLSEKNVMQIYNANCKTGIMFQ